MTCKSDSRRTAPRRLREIRSPRSLGGHNGTVSWINDWDEAAKRPWRTVISVCVAGLVAGGLFGYFRFGDSVAYGVVLGVGVATILGVMTWRTVSDPVRVAELRQRRRSPVELRRAGVRLAIPFIALAVAFVAGVAASSVGVFVITLGIGLAAGILLRLFVLR